MIPDDPNHRPTMPLGPPVSADATRTYSNPASTLPYSFGPPIVGPVDTWPAGLTRYKPLHLLGDGGMGEVYLAHDNQLDRQVAIKFARLGRHPAADTADRILAEARAAARLHHPGICPVFDADVCDGVPYLTMAFVQGSTLAAELKRLGPCPPAYAARLVRTVAEAMQYAHDHGVIHRDLKPGNILLTADHTPVVTDFGLAVRLDREGLADGVISGTPHYMAPEQAAGDAAKIGERTDVFALGVILFEMLTGRVPFDGTPREVLEQVKTKAVPPVRSLRKDVPAPLARVVAKATAHNPADRYDGMTAFADALTHSLRTTQARPKKSMAWLFWAVVIPTGVLLAGCLLLCGVGLLLPAIQKVREPQPPGVTFRMQGGPTYRNTTGPTIPGMPEAGLEGGKPPEPGAPPVPPPAPGK
jgi:serine/threonine protein kinase